MNGFPLNIDDEEEETTVLPSRIASDLMMLADVRFADFDDDEEDETGEGPEPAD